MIRPPRRLLAIVFAFLASGSFSGLVSQVPANQLASLTYRHIGVVGNRIASVAGVVGDPLTYYAGAASGGLWKTEDAGITWRPCSKTRTPIPSAP